MHHVEMVLRRLVDNLSLLCDMSLLFFTSAISLSFVQRLYPSISRKKPQLFLDTGKLPTDFIVGVST